jgi:ABC-2 type transport system permease protein
MSTLSTTVSNVATIALREALVRIRTRSFVFGTVLLMAGVVAIALVPVFVGYIDRGSNQKVEVWVGATDLHADPVSTLDVLLNAKTGTTTTGTTTEPTQKFKVSSATDLATARTDVMDGKASAALGIERGSDKELHFTLYSNDAATGGTAQLIRQAANALAIADRLDRLGVNPTDQATLFAPATYAVTWPDPTKTAPTQGTAAAGSAYLLGFGMTVLIFMMIVLYGNWVAMSVVDEKSSRVMEVILNAATPFQLLSGKVLGVGIVAFVQYLAILVAGGGALLLQGQVGSIVLGEGGGLGLPEGLTIWMLLVLVVYGVLGFLLYAVLYAAAGSLVSRQEDVNSAVMPMTLVSLAGYMIAVYTSTGLLDLRSDWLAVLSQIPFVSPFLMLNRFVAGQAQGWEVLLSIALLVVTIGGALWVAGRIYAAGVLIYGQRPSLRAIWRLMRVGM